MKYFIINVEEKQVTFAGYVLTRRSAELTGAASFELVAGQTLPDVAKRIATAVKSTGEIILCLPQSLFAHRSISLPLKDVKKVREILPAQLRGEIAIPVEELALDALPAGEGDFLALWARKTDIIRYIEIFREAGIEPKVVTSLTFAWSFIPGVPDDSVVSDDNTLALISGGRLTFFRTLDSPRTASKIAATLTALELKGVGLPQRHCLLGAGAQVAGDDALPMIKTEKPAAPPGMGHLFKNDSTFNQLAGLYAVAKARQAGVLADFRRGELAWTAGDEKVRRKFRTTIVLVAILIVTLFAEKWLQYRAVTADLASLNKSISAIYREIFPGRAKAIDEVAEISGEIKKLAVSESNGAFLDILKKLAEVKGASVKGLYEAEIEGRNLRIKGDAISPQAVNDFKTTISPFMSSIDLGEVKSRPDGTVTFSLNGMIRGPAK